MSHITHRAEERAEVVESLRVTSGWVIGDGVGNAVEGKTGVGIRFAALPDGPIGSESHGVRGGGKQRKLQFIPAVHFHLLSDVV